jgi:hypothetical protein
LRGVIEGFSGIPWTTDARLAIVERVAAVGMNAYVYTPEDEPKHRAEWRAPYDADELAAFAAIAARARDQRLVAYGPRFAVYAAVVQLADGVRRSTWTSDWSRTAPRSTASAVSRSGHTGSGSPPGPRAILGHPMPAGRGDFGRGARSPTIWGPRRPAPPRPDRSPV